MNKKNKGFTTIELITSFTLASVIMLILFNIILILKDNLSKVNAKTNMLVEKDNLSYNINKRFKEKEISSITMCDEGDKCYEFTYSDDTSDKLIYSNTDKTITFNNYTFDIIDGITVEEPTITEHYDTMSSTKYNGYFIIHIPIKIDNKDYSIKVVKHFNTDSLVIDVSKYEYDNEGNRYTIVDYLESTGTQYIDTGVIANDVDLIKISFIINKFDTGHQGIIGGGWSSNNVTFQIIYNYQTRVIAAKYGDALFSIEADEFIHDVELSSASIIFDGIERKFNNSSINDNRNIVVFARNKDNLSYGIQQYSYVKIFYNKLYNNDILVRDYIPVIDSTERPCLFDKVSRECYYNQGTGEFLYG